MSPLQIPAAPGVAGRSGAANPHLIEALPWIPDWAPDWAISLTLLVAAAALAVLLHRFLYALYRRATRNRGPLTRALEQRTRGPVRLALVIAAVSAATAFAPMSPRSAELIRYGLLVAFIILLGWAAMAALRVATVIYSRRFRLDVDDNLVARKHITQIRILERTAAAFIVVVTLAAMLMTLPSVRQYGVTLLASAGAAGIIAGLALQPLLTNLIAGVQIAITQPIRIDDAVVVEDEFGRIEEIGATYVVVRLWDLRRMILPLTYFIQQPFENWTRDNATLIGSVMIHVDYRAPLDAMRHKLEQIAAASPRWNGQVVNLAVTDLTERTMQVRCLVGARNAGDAFDLRTEVREQMVTFLREEHPYALPQDRLSLSREAGSAMAGAAI